MKKKKQILYVIVMMCMLVSCKVDNPEPKTTTENTNNTESITLSIVEIGEDYFLGQLPWASVMQYKVFSNVDKDNCVGDYVDVKFDEMVEKGENSFEITAVSVEHSDFVLEEDKCYKPVIYLYPTEITEVSVSLDFNGTLTHTYPEYSNGWDILAHPNGTLEDTNGIEYPYLFWEGESNIEYDMSKGFCISGEEMERFLRNKLAHIGLNQKELEEFIVFWLPFMEKNPYNKICFQSTAYTENAKLIINPAPDSLLRVYMTFQPLDEFIQMEEQSFEKFERIGFSVVEWGGCITNK